MRPIALLVLLGLFTGAVSPWSCTWLYADQSKDITQYGNDADTRAVTLNNSFIHALCLRRMILKEKRTFQTDFKSTWVLLFTMECISQDPLRLCAIGTGYTVHAEFGIYELQQAPFEVVKGNIHGVPNCSKRVLVFLKPDSFVNMRKVAYFCSFSCWSNIHMYLSYLKAMNKEYLPVTTLVPMLDPGNREYAIIIYGLCKLDGKDLKKCLILGLIWLVIPKSFVIILVNYLGLSSLNASEQTPIWIHYWEVWVYIPAALQLCFSPPVCQASRCSAACVSKQSVGLPNQVSKTVWIRVCPTGSNRRKSICSLMSCGCDHQNAASKRISDALSRKTGDSGRLTELNLWPQGFLLAAYVFLVIYLTMNMNIPRRDCPILRINTIMVVLVTLTLYSLSPLNFTRRPSECSCRLCNTAFGITYVLCISCVLGKTIRVLVAFRATLPGNNVIKWFRPSQQRVGFLAVTLHCLLVYVLFTIILPSPNLGHMAL